MAYATLLMERPKNGQRRMAPVGFSWTAFLFGPLVPLLRRDITNLVGYMLLGVATLGLFQLIFPFIYNKIYIKGLIKNGYMVRSVTKGTVEEASFRLGLDLPTLKLAGRD